MDLPPTISARHERGGAPHDAVPTAPRATSGSRSGAPKTPRRFLPEVQALRALAVGLVVIYHLYPRAAPGGFVGVDVFFVISGFLITSHLLREVQAKGRISLPAFWAARIRRIMPAAIVVILAIVVATLIWWPSSLWEEITRQGLASLLSVQNWVLALDSVDYMAQENQPTALQHFWSLGVEEQFYIFWPLVVLAAAWLALALARGAKRRNGGRGRRAALPVTSASSGISTERFAAAPVRIVAAVLFAVIIAVSLGYSILLVNSGDAAAYFVTTARVWEMAAGGLLAAMLPAAGWAAPVWLRNLTAVAGVAVLAWVAFSYVSGKTPFPGQGAILPVLGTMAVIAAGRTAGWGSLHRLTDAAPVQWVGNISYSLYLWHWPVVIVFKQVVGTAPRWWQALALIALSLALAAASYYFVERPARTWRFTAKHTWRAVGIGAVATALAAVVVAVPAVRAQAITTQQASAAAELLKAPPKGFGAQAWDTSSGAPFVSGTAITPIPGQAARDLPKWRDCVSAWDGDQVRRCEFGDTSSGVEVALVGDSHAGQWIGAMDAVGRERGFKVVTYVKNSCPFSFTPRELEKTRKLVCSTLNQQTARELAKAKPALIIFTSWNGSTYAGDAVEGFRKPMEQFAKSGIKTAVLRDSPSLTDEPETMARDCVAQNLQDPEPCSLPRHLSLPKEPAVAAAKKVKGAATIDTASWFCDEEQCPSVIGNVLVYRDANHVSNTYALTLTGRLGDAIQRLLPDAAR
ncbi:acyltransferase family protein [Galactobacter caseinivorans]|uniref:Acyltransferase n=1 Tax=Galactobacter caseinivorans TaxID=2676123 RepID=A0A496PIQ8_9MICC|nr:acyltransferase family protein [Galactobacter caseinivorans]RKW70369.1 acyltransferase [Galactobacter caseinivorans]